MFFEVNNNVMERLHENMANSFININFIHPFVN